MTGCKTCSWWKPVDNRKFIGICGHRDHGGEMTDRTEGGNCQDHYADAVVSMPSEKETAAPAWDA